jgi:hypothetical protein
LRNACCRQVVALTVALAAGVTGVAQAATLANGSQRRAMLRTSGIGFQDHAQAGYVKWAVISTKGPYAVAMVAGRRKYRREFQAALAMLHRTGARWHAAAIFEDESCPSVPAKVFTDLRHWFLGPGVPRLGRRPAEGIAGLLSPRHPCATIAHR